MSHIIRYFLGGVLALLLAQNLFADEVIPPKPAGYFNDYAHVVDANTASQLNEQLAQFERDTSSQVMVAVFPKMQTDSSIEDYTLRVARSWGVGQKANNNGVVLFVFIQDHKLFIQTGYGQEGPLPDITCKQIIDNEITPRFKQGDYTGGLTAGVNAIMQAVRGEYKGSGKTVGDKQNANSQAWVFWVILIIFILISVFGKRNGTGFSSAGSFGTGFLLGGGGGFSGGSGGGGGGFSGFSGGGGSFGGGGAGGSW